MYLRLWLSCPDEGKVASVVSRRPSEATEIPPATAPKVQIGTIFLDSAEYVGYLLVIIILSISRTTGSNSSVTRLKK